MTKKAMSIYTTARRGLGRPILLTALYALALSACAHPIAPMRDDHTIMISGKRTAGNSDREAAQKMVIAAARMTLDHGFRYFEFVGAANSYGSGPPAIRPGVDVTIRVYRTDPHRPGVRDAESVAAGAL